MLTNIKKIVFYRTVDIQHLSQKSSHNEVISWVRIPVPQKFKSSMDALIGFSVVFAYLILYTCISRLTCRSTYLASVCGKSMSQ